MVNYDSQSGRWALVDSYYLLHIVWWQLRRALCSFMHTASAVQPSRQLLNAPSTDAVLFTTLAVNAYKGLLCVETTADRLYITSRLLPFTHSFIHSVVHSARF